MLLQFCLLVGGVLWRGEGGKEGKVECSGRKREGVEGGKEERGEREGKRRGERGGERGEGREGGGESRRRVFKDNVMLTSYLVIFIGCNLDLLTDPIFGLLRVP